MRFTIAAISLLALTTARVSGQGTADITYELDRGTLSAAEIRIDIQAAAAQSLIIIPTPFQGRVQESNTAAWLANSKQPILIISPTEGLLSLRVRIVILGDEPLRDGVQISHGPNGDRLYMPSAPPLEAASRLSSLPGVYLIP